MRQEITTLKGVLRFPGEIRLDLRELSGLVAIAGNNGDGKTSLLESFPGTLYRQLPSRPDKEVFDYAADRDSYIEQVFSYGDRRFRARLALDPIGRRSDAVLVEILPDGTERMLSDGKVKTYDAAVRQHLPAQSVLLASAFAAQSRRGSFVHLDRAGRRALFGDLLGLEHYKAMAQTARAALALIDDGRRSLQGRQAALAAICGDDVERALTGRTRETESQRAHWTDERERVTARIWILEADEAAAVESTRALETARDAARQSGAELQDLDRAIAAADAQRAVAAEQQRCDVERAGRERERTQSDLAARLAQIERDEAAETKSRHDKIANNRALMARADSVRKAAGDAARIEREIATLTDAAAADRESARGIERDLTTVRRQLGEIDLVDAALARDRQAAALLTTVPCAGQGPYAGCALLRDAQAAAARIADLEARAAVRPTLEARLAELTAAALTLHAAEVHQAVALRRLQQQLAAARDAAREESHIALAETKVAEHQAALTEIAQRAARQRAEAEAAAQRRIKEIAADLVMIDARAFNALDGAARTIQDLSARRPTLARAMQEASDAVVPLAAAAARLPEAQRALREARQEHAGAGAQLARLEERLRSLDAERVTLDRQRELLATVSASVSQLDTERQEWQTLVEVLRPEGLPTLEIDAAGPTVSADCNDLMQASFGGRFSLDLVTQESTTDGKGVKETFELKVLDNQRAGAARDVTDLSGGEQVIVDECLKSAIAIFSNRRSQTPILTCWRDETTGGLDAENSERYLRMLRRLRELAGFELILFITHNDDLKAQADAQIHVHDGTAEIVLPAFAERRAA